MAKALGVRSGKTIGYWHHSVFPLFSICDVTLSIAPSSEQGEVNATCHFMSDPPPRLGPSSLTFKLGPGCPGRWDDIFFGYITTTTTTTKHVSLTSHTFAHMLHYYKHFGTYIHACKYSHIFADMLAFFGLMWSPIVLVSTH